ncbi:beta-1 adrenergic receptor-like [Oculina patagonica]
MNHTTDNTTLLRCGVAFLPMNPEKISPDLHAVFTVRLVVNALTCPLIILLNILVMVAVKTKQQLRTKSNVALACLATTDLVVGLVVQPLHFACYILLFQGKPDVFCSLKEIATDITVKGVLASLFHSLLMSAERYVAVKHPFAHESKVSKARIMIVSGLVWAAAIILPTHYLWLTNRQFLTILAGSVILFLYFPAMIYFNVAVYKEVRRNEKQIAANQVSLEAKEKILKNKKAFFTTTIVLLAICLCYVPVNICFAIINTLKGRISVNVGHIVLYLVTLLPVLNSLLNPLIYTVRIRYFRVAFIQLLSRKTVAQAEELEMKIFALRQIEVEANVEQGQNRASQEEHMQQGNEALNNGHDTTAPIQQNRASQEDVQQVNKTLNNELETTAPTQPQEEYEETPL